MVVCDRDMLGANAEKSSKLHNDSVNLAISRENEIIDVSELLSGGRDDIGALEVLSF